MTRTTLLASSALAILLLAAPAAGRAADADGGAVQTAAVEGAADIGSIVVYGQGQTRQVQTVTQADIQQLTPGTSALKVIAKLPGVNFESSDPWGAYEWSSRISIRGFNQNQLGFTLDGVPLGDMSYGNYNGLHISRAIATENIGRVELAQGTGALSTASSSNLGGTIQTYSLDPSMAAGGFATATYGSDDTTHGFLRLNSGEVAGGGRGFVSYTWHHAHKWKGNGTQKQQIIDAKWVQPVGPVNLTAYVNYSDRRENDYQDLSLFQIETYGWDLDNITGDWATAVRLATEYQKSTPGYPTYAPGHVPDYAPYTSVWDVYYDASGLRKDALGYLRADWKINDRAEASLTGYGHHDRGQGTWFTPDTPSPGGGPISYRTTEYDINRGGVFGHARYRIAGNTIEAGGWYERINFGQARRYYGLGLDAPGRSSLQFQDPSQAFATAWEWDFKTDTAMFYLQDEWQVTDALKLSLGFKSLDVTVKSQHVLGSSYDAEIRSKDNFLPQAGFNFRVNETGEIFGDYSENIHAFGGVNGGPFAASQANFELIKKTLKPERSDTFELGYRLNMGPVQGVLAGYYVKFKDRLLSISQCPGISTCFSALANVGSVTSKGIEAAATWTVTPEITVHGAYAFNDATYDEDVVPATGPVIPTGGKTVVDSPRHIASATLTYDNGTVFGSADLSYLSRRYATYLNDEVIPGRATVNVSLGYRFHGERWIEGLTAQVNVTNLLDKRYVSTIGTNGYVNSDPTGVNNPTLQAAPPRQVFVTLSKAF